MGLREPFNALSHAVGALAGAAGLVGLLLAVDGPREAVAAAVYGGTLVLLFSASALYHGLRVSERIVRVLRRMDHAAIFVFIAGTYTPVCLVTLGGAWGWTGFGVIWALAAAGVIVNATLPVPPRWLSALLYVGMGWLALVAARPLMDAVPLEGLLLLIAGGAVYTLGAVVYALRWPRLWPGRFGAHELWHCFVLAGSAVHFVFVARFAL